MQGQQSQGIGVFCRHSWQGIHEQTFKLDPVTPVLSEKINKNSRKLLQEAWERIPKMLEWQRMVPTINKMRVSF